VVLARMDAGASYADALAEAQRLGYAEADPTLDVEGVDAAHKLTLLGRLAFDPALAWEGVRRATRGIARLAPAALAAERERGRRVRLVASLVPGAAGWEGRVRPVALPEGHPLLTDGATNALLFRGDPLGEVLLRGPGAGGGATASGVLGDLLACLRGAPGPRPPAAAAPLRDAPGADEPPGEVADGAAAWAARRPAPPPVRRPPRSPTAARAARPASSVSRRRCWRAWRPTAASTCPSACRRCRPAGRRRPRWPSSRGWCCPPSWGRRARRRWRTRSASTCRWWRSATTSCSSCSTAPPPPSRTWAPARWRG